jgi:hypothetical protein
MRLAIITWLRSTKMAMFELLSIHTIELYIK